MPAFVRAALVERDLMADYRQRPAYQRNDYLSWIRRAKGEETRQRRLGQMLAELAQGNRYMKMVWSPLRMSRTRGGLRLTHTGARKGA